MEFIKATGIFLLITFNTLMVAYSFICLWRKWMGFFGSEWKKYPDEKPDDRQNVAFIVRSTRDKHLNGRVLGGFYSADSETFSVPGCGFMASYWRPMFVFDPPEAESKDGDEL